MALIIKIVCFDINNDEDEGLEETLDKNMLSLESPLRILDEFLGHKLFLESSKIQLNSSEIKYTFQTNFSENNIIFEIFVIYDLSYIHEINIDADACLLFINLEKSNTIVQLEKITEYILDTCSMNIKTYIIGMYNDIILPALNKESMECYLKEDTFVYEYFQIKCDNAQIIDKNEKLENNEKKRNFLNNHYYSKKNNKNISNLNIIDTILIILRKIYEMKLNNNFEPKHLRYYSFSSKECNGISESNSGCNCSIF